MFARRRAAPTRWSCSSTPGPRSAARSSSTRARTGNYMRLPLRRDRAVHRRALSDRRPARERRAVTGQSSGGYGALVLPMLRPDVFGALVAHARDALFEACYLRRLLAARCAALRDHYRRLLREAARRLPSEPTLRLGPLGRGAQHVRDGRRLLAGPRAPRRGAAAVRHAHRRADRRGLGALARRDPVRMAPRHVDALRGLRHIHLEAGRGDEYMLDLGARRVLRRAQRARRRAQLRAVRRRATAASPTAIAPAISEPACCAQDLED